MYEILLNTIKFIIHGESEKGDEIREAIRRLAAFRPVPAGQKREGMRMRLDRALRREVEFAHDLKWEHLARDRYARLGQALYRKLREAKREREAAGAAEQLPLPVRYPSPGPSPSP